MNIRKMIATGMLGGQATNLLNALTSYWKMDEANGDRYDVFGVSNLLQTGTINATALAKLGARAVVLGNGTNNRLQCASNNALIASPSWTVALWWKRVQEATTDYLFEKGTEYYLYCDRSSKQLQFVTPQSWLGSSNTIALNSSYLILFGRDASTGKQFINVNGTVNQATAAETTTGSAALTITASGHTGASNILGPVMRWNRTLTSAEISSLSNGGMGLGYPFYIPSHVIAFDGDSLTNGGLGSTAYPNQCITSLGGKYNWSNLGTSGDGFDALIAAAPTKVDPLVQIGKKNICVICAGINDMYWDGSVITGAQVYALYQTYVAARKAAGWNKVIVTTLTPSAHTYTSATYETRRQDLNTLLRADFAGGDGMVDPGGNAIIGDVANCGNAAYFTDGLHMTAAGYAIWAGLAKTALLAI